MRETILYVDDEELNLELFKENFDDEYEVLIAGSGKEGLGVLNNKSEISLVISDVSMPGMNGFEFIQKVKVLAPDKICMILSAYRKSDFVNPIITKKDIFRYLNKPFRRDVMSRIIKKAIDSYRNLEEA